MSTNDVTNNPGEPWQLTYDDMPDDAFVDGLRLSTDCPARRLIVSRSCSPRWARSTRKVHALHRYAHQLHSVELEYLGTIEVAR